MTTTFGAFPSGSGVQFSVWAPEAKELLLVLYEKDGQTESKRIPLQKDEKGIFKGDVKEASTGTLYKYVIDGNGPFPDPASRFQPNGVHGCSQVVDHSTFKWNDSAWKGLPNLEQAVIYELHVGTFTKEGDYKGVQKKLEYLKNELGVTVVEILPLADCPGRWNWGYDGVSIYAPSRAYGAIEELKELINAAHQIGLAVLIDLVYNHLGPDGNYLSCYNPHYFTKKHNTPWGAALNYDRSTTTDKNEKQAVSAEDNKTDASHAPLVREFILDNVVTWIRDYHFDGARLDATHAIVDYSKPHVLQELVERGKKAGGERKVYFFAEDDRNEAELVTKANGLDCLWADDFHHQVRVALAGDNESYFASFTGSTKDLAETIKKGWFYCGQTNTSGEKRGTDPTIVSDLSHFCCCIQNHDQIGNRAMGERLNHQISPHAYRLASSLLLLVPEVPMLFQGQEWASSSPFQFFTDHNAELGKLVTEGRRKEFGKFKAFNDPKIREKIPDPQAESTFQNSKLKWEEVHSKKHEPILKLYQTLLKLRLSDPALQNSSRDSIVSEALDESTVLLIRNSSLAVLFHLKDGKSTYDLAKIPQIGSKAVDIVMTSEDGTFLTEGEQGQAPSVEGGKVTFSRASAIVLRIKA